MSVNVSHSPSPGAIWGSGAHSVKVSGGGGGEGGEEGEEEKGRKERGEGKGWEGKRKRKGRRDFMYVFFILTNLVLLYFSFSSQSFPQTGACNVCLRILERVAPSVRHFSLSSPPEKPSSSKCSY